MSRVEQGGFYVNYRGGTGAGRSLSLKKGEALSSQGLEFLIETGPACHDLDVCVLPTFIC